MLDLAKIVIVNTVGATLLCERMEKLPSPNKSKIKVTSFVLFLSLDYYPDSASLNQYLVGLKQGLVRELFLDLGL